MNPFEIELTALLNRFSQENASGTPDFILAQYLQDCLRAFNAAVNVREAWYGRPGEPAKNNIELIAKD